MSSEDLESELALVSEAIRKVLTGGQDVSYNGRRVARADLKELRAHRSQLVREISSAERGGGLRVRGGTPI